MRLLTVTNCPADPDLGSGKTVVRFTSRLRELGHVVDILEPAQYEIARGMRRASRIRKALGAYIEVGRQLERSTYDIVEFFGAEFWPTIVRLARRRHRPFLVAHTNGLELLDLEREREYGPKVSTGVGVLRDAYNPLLKLSFTHADAFVSLCEADNPGHVKAPSATQLHATILVGVVVGIALLLFLLRFAVDQSGPFGTSVSGHVALADGGVQVAVSVTNTGDSEGIATCRITRDGTPRPDDLAFRTDRLAPGATVTVTRVVPAPAGSAVLVPERMTVICA